MSDWLLPYLALLLPPVVVSARVVFRRFSKKKTILADELEEEILQGKVDTFDMLPEETARRLINDKALRMQLYRRVAQEGELVIACRLMRRGVYPPPMSEYAERSPISDAIEEDGYWLALMLWMIDKELYGSEDASTFRQIMEAPELRRHLTSLTDETWV